MAPIADPKRDYYSEAGAHPDIVARLWDRLERTCRLQAGHSCSALQPLSITNRVSSSRSHRTRRPASASAYLRREGRPDGLRTVAKWTGGGCTDMGVRDGMDLWFACCEQNPVVRRGLPGLGREHRMIRR